MAEEKSGVRAAKRVAGTYHGVGVVGRDRIERHAWRKSRRHAADRARSAAGADRFTREREFDEAATSERVAQAAFPGDKRSTRKRRGQGGALKPAGFEGAGAMTLEPQPSASGCAARTPTCRRACR